jgi:UDP-glucose 4-epimerase
MSEGINPYVAFERSHCLVTGGLGFIGSHLVRKLVHLGAHVTLVDSMIPEYGGNHYNVVDIQDRIQVNISDVRDPYSIRALLKGKQYLFNLAGQTSHMDSMSDPYTDLEINARAQLSILENCRRENLDIRIVFASTRQIYGKPQYLPVDEKHPLNPVDVNGIHKLAGEQYHMLYAKVYGLKTTCLRLTNTYGPAMRIKDSRQTFVGTWLRMALEGKPFEVWGGEQLRDFNYVSDVVDALLLSAVCEGSIGRIMNLGGGEVVSLKVLAELLCSLQPNADFKIASFPEERKKIDIGDFYANYDLAESLLGWKPAVTLRDGLALTLEFYREHFDLYR